MEQVIVPQHHRPPGERRERGGPAGPPRPSARLSPEVCGLDLRVVVHGHDRDEWGFFYEGETQLCPVIFGATRANKRYLRLDLGARYESAQALREDTEIVRLYAQAT